jgi:hypothetical protein
MSNSRKNGSRKASRWSRWLGKRSQLKSALRRPVVETLEDRRLMSVTPLPQTQAALSRMLFNGQASYDNAASVLNSHFASNSGSGGGSSADGAANITLNVSEVEPNNTRLGSQFVNLGTAPGKSDIVNIAGTVTAIGEEDYYSFDLRKGDILDVRLTAVAIFTIVQLTDISGKELFVATGPNYFPAPNSTSPRFQDGLINFTYVIDTTARYAIRVGDQIGSYTLIRVLSKQLKSICSVLYRTFHPSCVFLS